MATVMKKNREPTVRREDSVLQNECRSAWRLANDGSWLELHGASDIEERWEQTANSLAASCFGLAPGSRMVAESGNVTLVATRDDEGVVIGLRDHHGNPITLMAALHRIETRVRTGVNIELVPRPTPRNEEPMSGSSVRAVAEYLNTINEMAVRYVDEATVADYWQRSFWDAAVLHGVIEYDTENGFAERTADRELDAAELEALYQAFASWKLRIRMAMGTIYEKIPLLKSPPWKQ